MEKPSAHEITILLNRWREGDQEAPRQLMPLVYEELYARAEFYLRKDRKHHTLSTTALVNEAYLKLAGQSSKAWQNRLHFFAIAAKIMKNVLLNYAQRRGAQKRGGNCKTIPLEGLGDIGERPLPQLVALGDGLAELEQQDSRKAWIVEMHYFGGLSLKEISDVLCLSKSTVKRELHFSRAWLRKYLGGE